MAKTAGDVRASKWESDIYSVNGERQEFNDLSEERKQVVELKRRQITNLLKKKYMGQVSDMETGDGNTISVEYTAQGLEHFTRDAMRKHSGKYFSEKSMLDIKQIFEKSVYVGEAPDRKGRKDGREYWFYYKDKTGRGVYFKVDRQRRGKNKYIYEFYGVDPTYGV